MSPIGVEDCPVWLDEMSSRAPMKAFALPSASTSTSRWVRLTSAARRPRGAMSRYPLAKIANPTVKST